MTTKKITVDKVKTLCSFPRMLKEAVLPKLWRLAPSISTSFTPLYIPLPLSVGRTCTLFLTKRRLQWRDATSKMKLHTLMKWLCQHLLCWLYWHKLPCFELLFREVQMARKCMLSLSGQQTARNRGLRFSDLYGTGFCWQLPQLGCRLSQARLQMRRVMSWV